MAPAPTPREHDADQPIGPSRLAVAVPALGSAERAAAVLGSERESWLGPPAEGPDAAPNRHLIDLELRVSEHAPRVAFRKAAFVEVGPLELAAEGGPMRMAISWRAASLTPLFPVFAGVLVWANGELQLDGYYEPPGGGVGVVVDRLLLNVAARATGRRLLERIAEVLRTEG